MQELAAKIRIQTGKKVKALRVAGFLPAVVYGEGTQSESIAVPIRDFEKAYQEVGETGLITLVVQGVKSLNTMIHDVAYDALSGKPIHADFYSVRMDKEIERKVPLAFVGEAPAVKNEGGILVKVMHEVEVRSLPKDLPREITVDVSGLMALGSKICMKDIPLPQGVILRADVDDVVVLIEAPRSEEELAELVAKAVTPEVVEVKTEQEVKTEEKTAKAAEAVKSEEASRR